MFRHAGEMYLYFLQLIESSSPNPESILSADKESAKKWNLKLANYGISVLSDLDPGSFGLQQ